MDSNKLISLQRTPSGWVASFYISGQPDAEIVKLFGTHSLPTPFTENAPYKEVSEAIERVNPAHWVTGHPANRSYSNKEGN